MTLLVPIIIASASTDQDNDPWYPDGMLGCVLGDVKMADVDTSWHYWVKKFSIPKTVARLLESRTLKIDQIQKILRSIIIGITHNEMVMLNNTELLTEQIIQLLEAIVSNPKTGTMLPSDMPFWLKHAILTQEN